MIFKQWKQEIERADREYGDFRSSHEGLGVLIEEIEELIEAIRSNDAQQITDEALQVAAVAYRIAKSMNNVETRLRSNIK